MLTIKLAEIIDHLFVKYKEDKAFGPFLKESGLIDTLIRKSTIPKTTESLTPNKEPEKSTGIKSEVKNEIEISNSDGFSKIIFEDLKIKRALSEHNVSQEHLLSQNDIRESFSYLAKNFNNVQLHQGEIWVIEYMGGL